MINYMCAARIDPFWTCIYLTLCTGLVLGICLERWHNRSIK